jgi:hypothetical protein
VSRIATCVWPVDGRLLLALDERLGPPVDSYVNGTQSWLTDDGPGGATLEWRLHPVAGYRIPRGLSHYELWEQAIMACSRDPDVDVVELGTESRALDMLWDGLECFAAYDDDVEPAVLASAATDALQRSPTYTGLVDHDRIGTAWERSGGSVSIVAMLVDELRADSAPS